MDQRLTPILTQVWVLHWVLEAHLSERAKVPQAQKIMWNLIYCE